jgi:hypothetical protein
MNQVKLELTKVDLNDSKKSPEKTQGTMQTVPPNQTVSNWTAVVSHSQRHIYFENEVGPAFARHSRGILSY